MWSLKYSMSKTPDDRLRREERHDESRDERSRSRGDHRGRAATPNM